MAVIFWFRRDLRLEDNHGLHMALKENKEVVPLFIFDGNILSRLEDPDDPRVTFIYDAITRLKSKLEELGSTLYIRQGDPVDIFSALARGLDVTKVYANHDYEPYARSRDEQMARWLASKNIAFLTYKDQVIFEREEVVRDAGGPYTVFTPYMKKWKAHFTNSAIPHYDPREYYGRFIQTDPQPMPGLDDLGFTRSTIPVPNCHIDRDLVSTYDRTRDIPSIEGTSRLGVHLRFGTVSIREVVRVAASANETFLNELIWREFYMMILWHFPHVAERAFKPQYDKIEWRNNEDEFAAWCEGRTGYPIVDAGMRQLNETGYMHNRLRMITASFLTKLLLVDWRWGEAYFARRLLDYELASNNGGWQWSAGTGCDAAPYFRIFNPWSQTQKFDPDKKFIKRWVPEADTEHYPELLVDYSSARARALEVYKKALN